MTRPSLKWYILVHQLPPRPLYLRAKIRNRLSRVGAVALKNSVYVLPLREECLEDFEWIAQEASSGGGEAFVLQAEFVSGARDEALVDRFQRQAGAAYGKLTAEIRRSLAKLESRGRARSRDPQLSGVLLRFREKLREVAALDFFATPSRREAETMLHKLERRLRRVEKSPPGATGRADLSGHAWVTRRDPRVDRLASAWVVRRFVDPEVRFRFIDPKTESRRGGEIAFDMVGGEFSHEGERCTFETILARLGIEDPALATISEIVHDIDLKDGKFGRPETPGVEQLILGLVRAHPDDRERLERASAFFDDLYASFRTGGASRGSRRPKAQTGRTAKRRARRTR